MSLDFVDVPDPGNVNQDFQLSPYKDTIAASASICTILQFLSGSLVCQKFVQKGSTNEVSPFPFVAGFLSCGLWLNYGMLIDDSFIVLVNSVGTILFMCYILLFYLYTLRKTSVVRQTAAVLAVMVCVRLYAAAWVRDPVDAQTHLGLVACVTTLLFFLAPLANLTHVLRMKSAESLPFPLILMTFIVTLQWAVYGVILRDPIIQYPNTVGCLLSLCQLSLFIVFPAR